jgi:hypothetical protein
MDKIKLLGANKGLQKSGTSSVFPGSYFSPNPTLSNIPCLTKAMRLFISAVGKDLSGQAAWTKHTWDPVSQTLSNRVVKGWMLVLYCLGLHMGSPTYKLDDLSY